MTRVPEPDQTPAGPAYQGRLLARPDDEVVDQGAGFDVVTLVTRRRIFALAGAGVGLAALAACGSADADTETISTSSSTSSTSSSAGGATASSSTASTTSDGEIPDETNGPYPADGTSDLNVLEDSGIVRSDITSSLDGGTTVDGVPLTFTFTLVDMANDNAPFAGAALYAWQCDAQGLYSMYSSGVEDETYLRGVQVADDNGQLTFQTIVPGCYQGRWPHIHFEVYPDVASATDVANAIATSQLAFPPRMLKKVYALDEYSGSTENLAGVGTKVSDDDIFGDGDWKLEVPKVKGNVKKGYRAALTVNIDTTTEPSGGDMGGGGGTPPSGGPGGGGTPPSGMPSGAPPSGAPDQSS